jgi:hypothetical protein
MADRAPAFQPAQGSPPTLEWVPVDRLQIDETYQRSIAETKAQQLIQRIARAWDWRLFQPLSVARRADGALFVIDGQHRLAAARLRTDLPHLPCLISNFDGVEEEASAFAAMNRQRRAMSKLETYRAELAAGEPRVMLAHRLIERAGLKLARHTNTASWEPGTIDCIGAVVRGIAQHGQTVPMNALIAMGEAWGKGRITCAGSVLFGLMSIYHEPPANFDPDALIATLAETTGRDLLDECAEYRHLYSGSDDKMRAVILARIEAERLAA